MVFNTKCKLNKIKTINDKFFVWKFQNKFNRKNQQFEKMLNIRNIKSYKSSFFINLIKNSYENKIQKEVNKLVTKKEKILNEIINKLKFENIK